MFEEITLVDIDDHITGYSTKEDVHKSGLLHRAFSVFIVNDNKMLIQMRNPNIQVDCGVTLVVLIKEKRKYCLKLSIVE